MFSSPVSLLELISTTASISRLLRDHLFDLAPQPLCSEFRFLPVCSKKVGRVTLLNKLSHREEDLQSSWCLLKVKPCTSMWNTNYWFSLFWFNCFGLNVPRFYPVNFMVCLSQFIFFLVSKHWVWAQSSLCLPHWLLKKTGTVRHHSYESGHMSGLSSWQQSCMLRYTSDWV